MVRKSTRIVTSVRYIPIISFIPPVISMQIRGPGGGGGVE